LYWCIFVWLGFLALALANLAVSRSQLSPSQWQLKPREGVQSPTRTVSTTIPLEGTQTQKLEKEEQWCIVLVE
jgi:hypothetical protein